MSMRVAAIGLVASIAAGCASTAPEPTVAPSTAAIEPWPTPPPVADGPLDASVGDELDRLIDTFTTGTVDRSALDAITASGNARLAWLLADILRFVPQGGPVEEALVESFMALTGVDPRHGRFGGGAWLGMTNLLIAWDLAEPPAYRERKAILFLDVEPKWAPFFADDESAIDWRLTTWGGVSIDDRPAGDRGACDRACIPALDDPVLTSADEGDWYGDDRTIFGVVVGGEAVALPKHIMEVHEMVNLTIGGRRVGIPYCTLCASATAYVTDTPGDEPMVLRTSGLLIRSNKMMYDLGSGSAFNTFTGRAISGPLHDAGVVLEQTSVTVSTWGAWKAEHPGTRIVARDGGIGRTYPDDPLCGRDDDGPIFPIGQPDPRLPAQAAVIGVIGPDGEPIAFAAAAARAELQAGRPVIVGDIEVVADAGGLRARTRDGQELVSGQSFWFAWSQFHPATRLWAPLDVGPDTTVDGSGTTTEGCWDLVDPPDRDR